MSNDIEDAELVDEEGLLTAEYPPKADVERGLARAAKKKPPGRPKGVKNKRTIAREQDLANTIAGGLTPLQFMLKQMRDEENPMGLRMEAAKNAAPYVHPKLAAIDHNVNITTAHEDALDELE